MDLFSQPLNIVRAEMEIAPGSFIDNFEAWPTTYAEVERAIGAPLHKQPSKQRRMPKSEGFRGKEAGALLLLLCEVLRLREATERCGAKRAYFERHGMMLHDDYIEAYIEAPPEVNPFKKLLGPFQKKDAAEQHRRRHTVLPLEYYWLDEAFQALDRARPAGARLNSLVIDLDQDWASQMGDLFGPSYRALLAILEGDTLSHDTAPALSARRPGRRL